MKINWGVIKFLLILILVCFLYSFTNARNFNRKLAKLDVLFLDENTSFITLNSVNKLLIQNKEHVTSIDKETLDLKEIEERLTNNPMIKKADVYLGIDGVLGVNIKQHNPIARVVANPNYYLDEDGFKMPLSLVSTARVPLIEGHVENNLLEVTKLLKKMNKDPMMLKSIIGINISKNGDMQLQLREDNFVIDFGKPINIEKKFFNYKAFYKKAKLDNTLTSYKLIDLKYNNQVVATKRTTHGGK